MNSARELPKAEIAAALSRTGLDVIIAGEKPEVKNDHRLYSAHNEHHSLVAFVQPDEVSVWELTGGTKEDRKAHVKTMRDDLMTKFNGEIITYD